jgi:hypothetical protein
MGSSDQLWFSQSQAEEITADQITVETIDLIHHQGHRLAGAAKLLGDDLITAGATFAAVGKKEDMIRLADGLSYLLFHQLIYALLVPADAAGIHHHIGLAAELTGTILAVPGQAGLIRHQGVPATGQAIEEGRFADVGTTDQGDNR